MHRHPLTLVLGATGKTGRRVADRLDAMGWPVRRASRRSAPAFDWTHRETWPAALAGAQQVYVTYQPDLAVPQAQRDIAHLLELCATHGVARVVLLSGRGEPGAQACEALVQRAPTQSTIVRASWFAQNFDEGPFAAAIESGVVALPIDGVPEPFIDVEDIVDVVVAALTEPGHAGQLYEVTGPQLLSFPEAIERIGEAAGRTIAYQRIPAEAYHQGLLDAGLPPPFADFLTELMTTVLDGRNARITDGVERALGRPARSFGAYADRVAATGAWSAS